jgi:hypothetical protein
MKQLRCTKLLPSRSKSDRTLQVCRQLGIGTWLSCRRDISTHSNRKKNGSATYQAAEAVCEAHRESGSGKRSRPGGTRAGKRPRRRVCRDVCAGAIAPVPRIRGGIGVLRKSLRSSCSVRFSHLTGMTCADRLQSHTIMDVSDQLQRNANASLVVLLIDSTCVRR